MPYELSNFTKDFGLLKVIKSLVVIGGHWWSLMVLYLMTTNDLLT